MSGQGAQPHPFRHALDQPPWRCRDCDASAADPLHCPHPGQHCSPSCTCVCHVCARCRAAGYDHGYQEARVIASAMPEVRQFVPHDPNETPEQQRQRIRDGVWMWGPRERATQWAEFDKDGNNVTEDTDPELTGNPDGVGVLAQEADLPEWMVAGQTVATEQPLAAFLMARLDVGYPSSRTNRMMEALRAIVRDHLAVHEIVGDDDPCTCHLLRQLASIWADHEAYLPEWRLR